MRPASLSWIAVIWSMIAAACLTMAVVHGLLWCCRREARAHCAFAVMAISTAVFAGSELWMMRAETPGQMGLALRWLHVPVLFIFFAIVGFVRTYLRAGRMWLAWIACGLHAVSLILDFVFVPNLNYWQITELRQIPFLGDSVAVAVGVPNPWMMVGQSSFLLLLVFVADAAFTAWVRGDRRQAAVVGGSILFFILAGAAQSVLFLWGFVQAPLAVSPFYLGIVVAMCFEISRDLLRAAILADSLQESEKRMGLAAEAAGLGVWIRDLQGDEMWASDQWRALFGFNGTERLKLADFWQKLHPEDREPVRQIFAGAVERGGRYETEYRVLRADGRVRWIASRGRVECNGDGQPIRVRGASVDITRRKRAELELHERRGELAHLSRVAMLGELSGSLAHELNQPLAAILSNAQAAEHYLDNGAPDLAQVREILADIVSEDDRAGEIIRRLRLLLKKGEVQQHAVDANEVVREVLKLARSDLMSLGVIVQTELAPDLPAIRGDDVQLQQVLLNLVVNACDAMRENDPKDRRLSVRTSTVEEGVQIEVGDIGHGLPADGAEKVFERFFTTKPHGLGLGLSVCRSIVAAHGGTLIALNNEDRGATFRCRLPVCGEREGAGGKRHFYSD